MELELLRRHWKNEMKKFSWNIEKNRIQKITWYDPTFAKSNVYFMYMCVYVCAACIDIYECIPQRKIQKNKHWNVDMTYFRAAGMGWWDVEVCMGRRAGEKEPMIITDYVIRFHAYHIIHTYMQTHMHAYIFFKNFHKVITKIVKVITLVWQDSRLTHSLYFYIWVYTIYIIKTKSIRLYVHCKNKTDAQIICGL